MSKQIYSLSIVAALLLSSGAYAQNVGIGETNPNSRLEVKGETDDATKSIVNFKSNNGTSRFFLRNDGLARFGILSGTGNRVVLANPTGDLTPLAAGTTSQFLRGDGTWQTVPGDNLGNHTATTNLAMGGFSINNANRIGINVNTSGLGMLEINSNITGPASWNKSIYFNNSNHASILTNGLLFGLHETNKSFYFADVTGNTFNKYVMQINASTGNVLINNLAGTGTRLVRADASGNLQTLAAGTTSQFLRGDGTWQTVPGDNLGNHTATTSLNMNGNSITSGSNFFWNGSVADSYAHIRVLQNNSTSLQDGMYINYNSTGGVNAHLRFYANGINERMRIDANSGNVGIGTMTPSERLHVVGNIRSGAPGYGFSLVSGGNPTQAGYLAIHRPDGVRVGYIGWSPSNMNYVAEVGIHTFNTHIDNQGANGYVFTRYMNISSPLENPSLYTVQGFPFFSSDNYMRKASAADIRTALGITAPTGDNLGNHTATTTLNLGANAISSSAGVVIDANGGWHRTYGNTGWYNGTYGGGIYMTDATWIRTYNSKNFYCNALIRADGGLASGGVAPGAGNIAATGTINSTGYKETSDLRWKKNITPIANPLQKVMAMKGVNYYFKTKDELLAEKQDTSYKFSTRKQIGFIAQEVESVLPEVVSTDPLGFKTVEYSKVVALLVEAIKEQQKEIEKLKQENASLKAQADKVKELENKMQKIEALLQQVTGTEAKK